MAPKGVEAHRLGCVVGRVFFISSLLMDMRAAEFSSLEGL